MNKKKSIFFLSETPLTEADREEGPKILAHDLINQTHGLLLFLKKNQKNGKDYLGKKERDLVIAEVETMQALVIDFFQSSDEKKRLPLTFLSFVEVVEVFKKKMSFYFGHEKYKFKIIVKNNEQHHSVINSLLISKIIGNVLKNIYEEESLEGEFIFINRPKELQLFFKNKLSRSQGRGRSSHSDLERGLGLKSMVKLCQQNTGALEHTVKKGFFHLQMILKYDKKDRVSPIEWEEEKIA